MRKNMVLQGLNFEIGKCVLVSIMVIILLLILIFVVIIGQLPSQAQDFTNPNIRVDHDAGDANSVEPSIAVDDNGNLYAAWANSQNGWDIYFSMSTDGGNTWSQEVTVDPDHWVSSSPSIATDGVNVYIVWSGGVGGSDVYFDTSPIANIDFSETDMRVNNNMTGAQINPEVSTDGTNVYVVWQDDKDGNEDIYFDYSPISNINFSGEDIKVNSDSGSEDQWNPSVTTDGTNVYIVWDDYRSGTDEDIYFDYSPISSMDFSSSDLLVSNAGSFTLQLKTEIVTDGTNIFIVWEDDREGDVNIYFDSSPVSAIDFSGEDTKVNSASRPGCSMPAIATDGTYVYTTYYSYTNDNTLNDIYYKRGTAGTRDFSNAEIKVNTDTTMEEQFDPVIAVYDDGSNQHVYVLWQDERNQNRDIYFAGKSYGSVADTTPPTITHTPITSGTAGQAITITTTITDNVDVVGVKLYYRITGEAIYSSIDMMKSGDIYTQEIMSSAVTTTGVEYYIGATDGPNSATHPSTDPTTSPHIITVTTISPPTGLSSTPGDGKVSLSWNPVTDADATGYNIYRSPSTEGEFVKINSAIVTDTSYEDDTVTNGVTYYYYVKTVDSGGLESLNSDIKSAKPSADGDDGKNGDGDGYFGLPLWLIVVIIILILIIVVAIILKRR
jgi:hypothetical protein